jgi:hypothetical protein
MKKRLVDLGYPKGKRTENWNEGKRRLSYREKGVGRQ